MNECNVIVGLIVMAVLNRDGGNCVPYGSPIEGRLAEGCLGDVTDEILDSMDAVALIDLIERAGARLRQIRKDGGTMSPSAAQVDEATFQQVADNMVTEKIHLRVTRDFRIYAGDSELSLQPLAKTLLLFYLKHNDEYIPPTSLPKYRNEMYELYGRLSPRTDAEGMRRTVDDLLFRRGHTLYTLRSSLSCSLKRACYVDSVHFPFPEVTVVWETSDE